MCVDCVWFVKKMGCKLVVEMSSHPELQLIYTEQVMKFMFRRTLQVRVVIEMLLYIQHVKKSLAAKFGFFFVLYNTAIFLQMAIRNPNPSSTH